MKRLTYKQLTETAKYVSTYFCKNYEFRVNRRNGYYALDAYLKDSGQYIDFLIVGDAHDIYVHLRGMIQGASFKDLAKPF